MLAIRAGRLIDGSGAEPQNDIVVLVDGERISQVATLRIPQMADASAGPFVYNGVGGLPV